MIRLLIAFLIGLTTFPVRAQVKVDNIEPVTIDLGTDHFVAGSNVAVNRSVPGDLLAAGRAVVSDSTVGGDAVLAGGSVHLNGNVSQSVYAAGGQVIVNGTISRNARLAGGNVEIAPSSRIDGGVSVGGGQARVSGSIGGYLQAAGGSLYINGPIGGDVEAAVGQLELGPNARIRGRLRYRSRQALKQDPAAQVSGGIEQLPPLAPQAPRRGLGRGASWIWTLGLMLLVAILLLVLPGFLTSVIETLESRPGASALLGFALLVCIPVASVILLITLVGAPLGLLSMTAYMALLLVGYVAAGAALGDWVWKRLRRGNAPATRPQIGAAIGGILAVAIIGRVPLLGGLVIFVALLLGIGAVGLQINRALHPATH